MNMPNTELSNKEFDSFDYKDALEINKARLEHLASLNIDLSNSTVLEVGAGVGWHTEFFEKLNCSVLSTDARIENVIEHKRRYPHRKVEICDLEISSSHERFGKFDIVYCYGTLYHLTKPEMCIADLSKACKKYLLLETCVNSVDNNSINLVSENSDNPNQSFVGVGCRPGRDYLWSVLNKYFPYVYISRTQPDHKDFPLSWPVKFEEGVQNCRNIFIASKEPINNPSLSHLLLYKFDRYSRVIPNKKQRLGDISSLEEKPLDNYLISTFKNKNQKVVEGVLLDNYKVKLVAESAEIGGSWSVRESDRVTPNAWDQDTLKYFYEKTLNVSEPVVIDVGANTGSFSLLASLNKDMKVYAFEPSPEVFNYLLDNISLNDLNRQIESFPVALSNKEGLAQLKYPASGKDSGLATLGGPERFTKWKEIEVVTDTLDNIVGKIQLSKIDFIKIDTEGHELYVLQGAENTINHFRPDILVEYSRENTKQFNYEPEEITKLLKSWGYSGKFVSDEDIYFEYKKNNGKTNMEKSGTKSLRRKDKKNDQNIINNDCIKRDNYVESYIAEAIWNQYKLINADKQKIKELSNAVGHSGDLFLYQWAQLMSFAVDYKPDLIIELGRGKGNSTCAFTEVANLLKPASCNVVSICNSQSWRETEYKLRQFLPSDWFTPLKIMEGDILKVDFYELFKNYKRILVFWDAHGFDVAETVLGKIMPLIANREHSVLMHDISDLRYSSDSAKLYGKNGLWKGNNWDGPRLMIGNMSTSVEQAIAIWDFTTRNSISLFSADNGLHRVFEQGNPRRNKIMKILGKEFFDIQAHWRWFSLNETNGQYTFPYVPSFINELLDKTEQDIRLNQLEEAKKILEIILLIDKADINALNNLTVIYILSKDYTKAKEIINTILGLDSKNIVALHNLSIVS